MIRKQIHIILFFITCISVNAQQELLLHFNRQLPQSCYTNPSFINSTQGNILLPSFSINYGNNSLSYNDIFKPINDTSSYLRTNNVLQNIKKSNIIQFQNRAEIIRIQWKWKQNYFSVAVAEILDGRFGFSEEFARLMLKGNTQYLGQKIEIGPEIKVNLYQSLSLGFKHSVSHWDFGYTVHLISGLANIQSTHNNATLYTSETDYAISVQTDYLISSSGYKKIGKNLLTNSFNLDNTGLGVDLGVNYSQKKYSFSGSLVNLGFIQWKLLTKNRHSKGSFYYPGINLSEILQADSLSINHLTDTIKNTFAFTKDTSSYTGFLTPVSYFSFQYQLNPSLNLGTLVYLEYFRGIQPALCLYANYQLFEHINTGFSYSIKNNYFSNFGISVSGKIRRFQFFALTDNIFGLFSIKDAKSISFRTGINIDLEKL